MATIIAKVLICLYGNRLRTGSLHGCYILWNSWIALHAVHWCRCGSCTLSSSSSGCICHRIGNYNGIEVSVGPKTWFLVAILQVVTYVLYDIHATAAFAYTSELSDDHNAKAKYNSSYNAILYVSMLVFLIQVSGVSTLLGSHDLGTARISQIITSSTTLVCFSLARKYLFRNRPASSRLPEGSSLWTCGFTKVGDTSRRLIKHCRPLMWATIAMMFSEAAVRIHEDEYDFFASQQQRGLLIHQCLLCFARHFSFIIEIIAFSGKMSVV